MRIKIFSFITLCFVGQIMTAQVILNANGSGNTYEDINAVLAPGHNAIEVPDCVHTDFGRHIDEIFNAELNTNVFRFFAHKTPDNDRCQKFDRQRTEIKTYNSSPDNLIAIEGETVQYRWKFKLPINFQVSPNFTHLHQIKSVGGPYASIPMITLTGRKASPDQLQLRYTPINDQNTIHSIDLDLLKGHWVDVIETIYYSNNGSYAITIKKTSDNATLLSYSNTNIDMWQDGASIARPKWGIYRSLINIDDLQDEEVLFNNLSIEENPTLSTADFETTSEKITLVPNPAKQIVRLKNIKPEDYNTIQVFDSTGRKVLSQKQNEDHQVDISSLSTGIYHIVLLNSNLSVKTLKCIVD